MFLCACRAIRRLQSQNAANVARVLASGYKSNLSLDILYPSSNQDFLRQVVVKNKHTGLVFARVPSFLLNQLLSYIEYVLGSRTAAECVDP